MTDEPHQTIPAARASRQLDDPVATRTEWHPLSTTLPRSHRLVKVGDQRIEFRVTAEARKMWLMTGVAVAAPGMGVALISAYTGYSISSIFKIALLTLGPAILVRYFFRRLVVPAVFDKRRGRFWKAWTEPEAGDALETVHALQLLMHQRHGGYELNLVLRDGNRISLYRDEARVAALEIGQTLAAFLGKPLWDAGGPPGTIMVHGG